MVRGCVSTEFEDASLLWPAEGAGAPAVELALPWTTPCGAPDPLPAAFANEAANTSDGPMVATAKTNLLMTCALRPNLSARFCPRQHPCAATRPKWTETDCSNPLFQPALPWCQPNT